MLMASRCNAAPDSLAFHRQDRLTQRLYFSREAELTMLGLLPRDHWEHRLRDLVEAFQVALGAPRRTTPLQIGELGECIPVRSARAALVVAIKALDLPPGARIGVPLYCCPVVFKAIAFAGCQARFVDVEESSFCMSARDLSTKSHRLDAVLAVHMFGNMCDMPGLQAASSGKPIIEDCAQSLGSRFAGHIAGSFGVISLFSFRSGKYLSVGEGGALFSPHVDLRSRLSQLIDAMPSTSRVEECLHLCACYVKSLLRSRPLYGVIGYALWKRLEKQIDLSARSGIIMGRIRRSDLAILKRRLASLPLAIIQHRSNAEYYTRSLHLNSCSVCPEPPDAFYNRYLYPVTFPSSAQRDVVASHLLAHRIDSVKYLDNIVSLAAKNYGYARDCPVAERLSKTVLIIPSHHSITKKDRQCIVRCLNTRLATP